MITLNLQMFAKSASQAKEYRKRKAKLKYELEAELKPKEEEEKKPEPPKKPSKGEVVSAVNLHDEYQIFIYENGKEKAYTDNNGRPVYRTGADISKKMVYNRNRDGWESKSQIEAKRKGEISKLRKYIIRKRVR